jgi:hypothetical protein
VIGDIGTEDRVESWNVKVATGCAALCLLALTLAAGLAIIGVGRDRNAAHYPGATQLTSHSNYRGLPAQIRWDNSYFTTDNFSDVYNWYSVTFDLGAEARAIERCILLEGPTDQIVLERYLSVLLCNTPEGQLIYVTRSTRLKFD